MEARLTFDNIRPISAITELGVLLTQCIALLSTWAFVRRLQVGNRLSAIDKATAKHKLVTYYPTSEQNGARQTLVTVRV